MMKAFGKCRPFWLTQRELNTDPDSLIHPPMSGSPYSLRYQVGNLSVGSVQSPKWSRPQMRDSVQRGFVAQSCLTSDKTFFIRRLEMPSIGTN